VDYILCVPSVNVLIGGRGEMTDGEDRSESFDKQGVEARESR